MVNSRPLFWAVQRADIPPFPSPPPRPARPSQEPVFQVESLLSQEGYSTEHLDIC